MQEKILFLSGFPDDQTVCPVLIIQEFQDLMAFILNASGNILNRLSLIHADKKHLPFLQFLQRHLRLHKSNRADNIGDVYRIIHFDLLSHDMPPLLFPSARPRQAGPA